MFENASEDGLANCSVPDEAFGFLAAHDDRAVEQRATASATGTSTRMSTWMIAVPRPLRDR